MTLEHMGGTESSLLQWLSVYPGSPGLLRDSDTLVELGHPSGTGSGTPWWDWDTLLGLGHWLSGTMIFQQQWDTLVAQGHPNGTEIHPGGTETLQGHHVSGWDIVTDVPGWDWDTLQRDTLVGLGTPWCDLRHPDGTGRLTLGHPVGIGISWWHWDTRTGTLWWH